MERCVILMKEKFGYKRLLFVGLIYLMVFQSPLEGIWDPFSYIDEIAALLGVLYIVWENIAKKKSVFPKCMSTVTVFLTVFSVAGLLGNIVYQYQPLKCVIIDLYTNLKFFFAILTGFTICSALGIEYVKEQANRHGRIIVGALFALFLLDRMLNIWPLGIRYGIRSAVLFYAHPTYLAGAAAFLAAMLLACYERKNVPFLAMSMIMLVFTMRSKAFASAAVFVAVYVFFVLLNRKVRFWHIVIAVTGCVIIAWPQISYYFIELGGKSTRSVMHSVAFQIAGDYFPIGTGFGTYASAEASKSFSPVYDLYNFEYLLRFEVNRQWLFFLNDTFWPIIIGQTGVMGTAAYVVALSILFAKCWKLQDIYVEFFAAVLYVWFHLMICSTAEPAFNNSTAIPMAILMGIALHILEKRKNAIFSKRG